MHDGRCPICRDSPYNEPSNYDEEDGPEEGAYVSYSEALKKGREAAKTDKSTARMMKTIKKWKKERSTAKRECKESQKKIQPLERAMNQKIDQLLHLRCLIHFQVHPLFTPMLYRHNSQLLQLEPH